jgi:seryl-tRNA synthetase
MSDTPRTDELKNKIERLLSQEAYDICSEILDQAQQLERELNDTKIRVSQAVEKMENATTYKYLPQVVYDALDILKGGTDAQQIRDYYEEQEEEPEKQDDRPRFKPGDKVWVIDENEAVKVKVTSINYILSDGTFCLDPRHSSHVFATKQELIDSL